MFYNFCGDFDKLLKQDYRKSKAKEKGITYPQFCIVTFANILDEGKKVLNIKTKKH